MSKIVLVVGACGVGKTWVMKQLLKLSSYKTLKLGKFHFSESEKMIVVGKYDGTTFEGSDRLSMSVLTDLDNMLRYCKQKNKLTIFEGDRFMNSTFITKAQPTVLKINGTGEEGRRIRNSNQTTSHLKRIETRVSRTSAHIEFGNSQNCLTYITTKHENN